MDTTLIILEASLKREEQKKIRIKEKQERNKRRTGEEKVFKKDKNKRRIRWEQEKDKSRAR